MADGQELTGNDHTVDIVVSGLDNIDDVGEVEAEVLGAFDRAEVNGRWTVAITRCSGARGWDVCVVSRCADRYVTVATRVDPSARLGAALPQLFRSTLLTRDCVAASAEIPEALSCPVCGSPVSAPSRKPIGARVGGPLPRKPSRATWQCDRCRRARVHLE
jgi:hypothetical protein